MCEKSNSKRLSERFNRNLSLQFSIHRTYENDKIGRGLFKGKLLKLFQIGSCSIGVGAFIENEYVIIGLIPKGMVHHLQQVLVEQDEYCVQVDSTNCTRLNNAIWISIDSLNQLKNVANS